MRHEETISVSDPAISYRSGRRTSGYSHLPQPCRTHNSSITPLLRLFNPIAHYYAYLSPYTHLLVSTRRRASLMRCCCSASLARCTASQKVAGKGSSPEEGSTSLFAFSTFFCPSSFASVAARLGAKRPCTSPSSSCTGLPCPAPSWPPFSAQYLFSRSFTFRGRFLTRVFKPLGLE